MPVPARKENGTNDDAYRSILVNISQKVGHFENPLSLVTMHCITVVTKEESLKWTFGIKQDQVLL